MYGINRPDVFRPIALAGAAGQNDQPLSYNRAPAADLAPWISRFHVTVVHGSANDHLSCGLFNDTSGLFIQLNGAWSAETADGHRQLNRSAMFVGPHSKRMPITLSGTCTCVGISLRPGAAHALSGVQTADYVDRIVPIEVLGFSSQRWLGLFDPAGDAETWIQAMEHELRFVLARRGTAEPDQFANRFETAAVVDPSISIGKFVAGAGIEQRRLERLVRRDFGLPPKQVLRRARALDMASHLRGVGNPMDAEALALRYYDQSHLIREFGALFGMSPRQFVKRPQPLLTLALAARQASRLDVMDRLAPGGVSSWQ
jgi:AraC-like DNA-binding protein